MVFALECNLRQDIDDNREALPQEGVCFAAPQQSLHQRNPYSLLHNRFPRHHIPWHLYLFNESEVVDVRAVHGNYISVWSGVLDVVESEDELAATLACELAHVLAHHTYPVQFNVWSDVFFDAAELVTSIAVMQLSQGMVAIHGRGWMKWAYVEVADLDPLDREYSEEHEREAAGIALLIISRTQYSPQALLDFWKRIAEDESLHDKFTRFSRSLSPQERSAMLEKLILNPPERDNKLAKKPTQ